MLDTTVAKFVDLFYVDTNIRVEALPDRFESMVLFEGTVGDALDSAYMEEFELLTVTSVEVVRECGETLLHVRCTY